MEDAIYFLRRRASTQTSAENSDVERRKKHRDESDEEVGDKEETEADTEVEEKRNPANKPNARISTKTTTGTTTKTTMEYGADQTTCNPPASVADTTGITKRTKNG
jgi:hypothetical protein